MGDFSVVSNDYQFGADCYCQGKITVLFSLDIERDPEQIFEYYQARFPIEFIFRAWTRCSVVALIHKLLILSRYLSATTAISPSFK